MTAAQINTRPESPAASARSRLSANKWDRAAVTAGPVAPGQAEPVPAHRAIYSPRSPLATHGSGASTDKQRGPNVAEGIETRTGRKGRLRPLSPLTIEEAADELLDGMRTGVISADSGLPYRPTTIGSYEKALRLRVLPALGAMKVSELRRADAKALVEGLQETGLSGSTIRNTLDPLRVILREARDSEIIATDPLAGLRLPSDGVKWDRVATAPGTVTIKQGGRAE